MLLMCEYKYVYKLNPAREKSHFSYQLKYLKKKRFVGVLSVIFYIFPFMHLFKILKRISLKIYLGRNRIMRNKFT